MKKILPLITILLIVLACAPFGQPGAPVIPSGEDVGTMVAVTLEALTASVPPATISATAPPPVMNGTQISYENIRFILPAEVGTSALAGTIPAVISEEQGAPWDIAPAYIKFELDGYPLHDTFHAARILIYPAAEYGAPGQNGSGSIAELQAILNGSAQPSAGNLPGIPFFNAGQLFAAQIKMPYFQGGSGVRFLTEYGQYYATANNTDLFYQFQGLTDDGKWYILAILPISHPLLAANEDPAAFVPQGGLPFPGWENENAIAAYYDNVILLLNSATPESFTPSLSALDALIQSIQIGP